MTNKNIMEVRHLTKHFPVKGDGLGPKKSLHAVDDVTFSLENGETLGVVGESGSGKSTLGRVLLKLIKETSGEVTYKGQDILGMPQKEFKKIRSELQMIFQDPYASLNPKLKIGASITEPMLSNDLIGSRAEAKERAQMLLELVGLQAGMYDRYPHEFSGGQRQRISIARAVSLRPQVLVCDEAVSALDVSVQAQILNLFAKLKEDLKLTYLFISHDLSVVKYISDRILVMYMGEIVELAPAERIFENTLHPYTQALISAIPEPSVDRSSERIILSGDITSPVDPPAVCRFAGRCFRAAGICKESHPELREVEPGHFVRCHFCEGGAAEGGEPNGRISD